MLSTKLNLGVLVAVSALIVADGGQSPSYATTCSTGDPVVAKPYASGGLNQFTFQFPISPMPNLPGAYHYTLVDDFPENFSGANISSGYINYNSGTGLRTELYKVVNQDQDGAGLTFTSCSIKAYLFVNGNPPITAYLPVKQGATQNDGAAIQIISSYPIVYERVMAVNPINGQPWTSDDLASGLTIVGVKNDAGPSSMGVGIGSIILECN